MKAIEKAARSRDVTKLQQQEAECPQWEAGVKTEVGAAGTHNISESTIMPAQGAQGYTRELVSNRNIKIGIPTWILEYKTHVRTLRLRECHRRTDVQWKVSQGVVWGSPA